MAKRLISLSELDEIEGLVEHHRKLQERLEALEGDAAQFDTLVQGALELTAPDGLLVMYGEYHDLAQDGIRVLRMDERVEVPLPPAP